ncbi:MAG: AAA-like domain-containing protein [Desulfobacterales bacterium]|nr:AAA-like domain-containing protein [Desulfobacterales bacterium]
MKRTFSSYGPVSTSTNYYVPRTELINQAYNQLTGVKIEEGHYFTVWAPRQTGKSWIMNQISAKFVHDDRFYTVSFSMQIPDIDMLGAANYIISKLNDKIGINIPKIDKIDHFQDAFRSEFLDKPLILIIDEFDYLDEETINRLVGAFRNMYNERKNELAQHISALTYMLHGLALIGVRSVLGIENVKGSPFNVQRSIHIPNLTYSETNEMFHWYQQDSGQTIEQDVIDTIYEETKGQPGLVSWFGELLTETYNKDKQKCLDMDYFEHVYSYASKVLPNNTIMNLISKAKQEPYKETLIELFQCEEKEEFAFHDPNMNFLYMNGIIDFEEEGKKKYVKFSCPFVQKTLFDYFASSIFSYTGVLLPPFEPLGDVINNEMLNIPNLIKLYQKYLIKNSHWLFQDAPRRKDLRVFEAVYHFNLFMYLSKFLQRRGTVTPEFPTGNGKIDILIHYKEKLYGLELKSFSDELAYHDAIIQAAKYGSQLKLKEIYLLFFVDFIDDNTRQRFEKAVLDQETHVNVVILFVSTNWTCTSAKKTE